MKKLSFVLPVFLCFLLCSCTKISLLSDNDAETGAKIHKRYMKMTSYSSDVKITVIGNKTEKIYQAKQYFVSPDKMMLDFSDGFKIILNGEKAYLINGDKKEEYKTKDELNYLFVNEFFSLYYRSMETAVSAQHHEGGDSTLFETELLNESAHRHTAILKINNKTLNPERLIVRDLGGKDVLYADFSSFLYNQKTDDNFLNVSGG